MALPTMATINTASNNIYAALTAAYREKRREGLESFGRVLNALTAAYKADVTLTVADATDANLTAFFGANGDLNDAFKLSNVPLEVGRVFKVTGAGDTTDNALQAAKGSAVAANDQFEITNTASPAVVYLGLSTALDFADELPPDL